MRNLLAFSLAAALAAAAAPAAAQSSWEGFYVGGLVGGSTQDDDHREVVRFDTDLDGSFDDNVDNALGQNTFTGYCGGGNNGPVIAAGCRSNDNDNATDLGLRGGYDWHRGHFVFGALGEVTNGGVTDSVTAFSSTPEAYTFRRELGTMFALRGRLGVAFGANDANLAYATAGWAWASVDNDFSTTDTSHTFTDSGDSSADGGQVGLGYERRFGEHFTGGLEWLMSDLSDDGYEVRAQGPASATDPFVLANPQGTDMRRGTDDIDLSSLRLTVSYRF
jgi:opacity protein-like surface antigen